MTDHAEGGWIRELVRYSSYIVEVQPVGPEQFVAGHRAPPGARRADAWVFAFRERALVLDAEGQIPTLRRFETAFGDLEQLGVVHYFGEYLGTKARGAGRSCFTLRLPSDFELAAGFAEQRLRSLYAADFQPIGLPRRAVCVLDWHRDHRFCGRCGRPTQASGKERSTRCETCELVHYPRVSPAVIMAVRRGDELLMARSSRHPEGMHSVLAGFIDAGESAEEAVMRELHEEVGIAVTDIEYFGSQSWPHPNAMMLGFKARYLSGEIVVDGHEIVAADWYPADRLPPRRPGSYSIAHWLIEDFIASAGSSSLR